ncbi:MAG: hypothetical protein SGARI_003257, partial [Bacillariaceae sp.]
MMGVFEPGGGMVRPERTMHLALKEAEEMYGATVWENTKVKSLQEVHGQAGVSHVELIVGRSHGVLSTVTARTVLVAAGAWTSELIPSWKPHLKPVRILQTWVDVSKTLDPSVYDSPNMPCVAMVNPYLRLPVYCLPADSTSTDSHGVDKHNKYKGCVKLGVHGGDPIDPNANSNQDVTAKEQAEMILNLQQTFCEEIASIIDPLLIKQLSHQYPFTPATLQDSVMESKPCMYTMTEDEHFMIGVPKGMSNVCAVAGLSGHGFKMTPALGQMLADFATAKSDQERQAVFDEKWKA